MLSKENNELLTRVTGDAPMGKLMRRFWIPALRSARLEPDGDPVRVRLFGKNYVAFRATDGRVGFFDEGCPHRGVSLLLARNEDCTLTCIFHGWKFDVSGKVVEVPTEPPERAASFCEKVPLKHYSIREAGSIVWVWLGEGEPTQFPMFEFNTLPDSHISSYVAYTNCNWLQGLEGVIDSAHVGVLHQSSLIQDLSVAKTRVDLAPTYELDPQAYGYRGGALRKMPDGSRYVRITEYVQPWYGLIPFAPEENHVVIFAVPVDDEHTAQWLLCFNSKQPMSAEDLDRFQRAFGLDPTWDPNDYYNPVGTFDNRWHQDREMLKQNFTGVSSLQIEDYVVQESMGPIIDRSQEYLGSSDAYITKVRWHLLTAVQDFQT